METYVADERDIMEPEIVQADYGGDMDRNYLEPEIEPAESDMKRIPVWAVFGDSIVKTREASYRFG